MLLRVRTVFDLSAMMHYDIFKNKATKNLYDYAAFMKKILRCAQDDSGTG